ncbi:MAG: flagellar protein [Lachnospiraceae bacterium]|nr:flagellar protein [Lachnospiraceae bacterium]MDE6698403.1 flagellar protein [Lachnospiraceae bacterium]
MEVKNCKECKRLFNYIGGPRLCPDCKAKLEEKFLEVKRFIEDNKNAPIAVVSEEMNVSVQQINQWVREERLIFAEGSAVVLDCENCGAPIRTGRFCEKCKGEMVNRLGGIYHKHEESVRKEGKEKARMRFLDN